MAQLFLLAACATGEGAEPVPKPYAVSGTVLESGGVYIQLMYTDLTDEAVTDGDGWWERTDLHGEVVVTVTDAAYDFAAASRRLSVAATNVGES